ncbi:hypothetical protein GCK32_022099 [Trichostrongylus colubriformis]|uniref:Uncharacterized protein n=1 Tax=Trichostrongylus colubriformis TaxID=6319 RepID=A0AAN8IQM8_TRICO
MSREAPKMVGRTDIHICWCWFQFRCTHDDRNGNLVNPVQQH